MADSPPPDNSPFVIVFIDTKTENALGPFPYDRAIYAKAIGYISFSDFIDPKRKPEVKDKIVIIAYDAERFEAVDTPAGKIRPHRAFIYALMSTYRQFYD